VGIQGKVGQIFNEPKNKRTDPENAKLLQTGTFRKNPEKSGRKFNARKTKTAPDS
jgi:hypothetical protein